jgi:hypothetical protein
MDYVKSNETLRVFPLVPIFIFSVEDVAAEMAGQQLALKPIKPVGLSWRGGESYHHLCAAYRII